MNRKEQITIYLSEEEKLVNGHFYYLGTMENQYVMYEQAKKECILLLMENAPLEEIQLQIEIMADTLRNMKKISEDPEKETWIELPACPELDALIAKRLQNLKNE